MKTFLISVVPGYFVGRVLRIRGRSEAEAIRRARKTFGARPLVVSLAQ